MEDGTSSTQNTVPFPTLTILYLPMEAETIVAEIGQKYNNMTAEDLYWIFCRGIGETIQEGDHLEPGN